MQMLGLQGKMAIVAISPSIIIMIAIPHYLMESLVFLVCLWELSLRVGELPDPDRNFH